MVVEGLERQDSSVEASELIYSFKGIPYRENKSGKSFYQCAAADAPSLIHI